MGGNEILIAAHLRMAACQLLSGAVVVDYQVMHADYLVGSGDDIFYLWISSWSAGLPIRSSTVSLTMPKPPLMMNIDTTMPIAPSMGRVVKGRR